MEGFVLLDTGAWSLVPPLLALALALITKEVYSSLLIGIVSGLLIYQFSLAGVGLEQTIDGLCLLPNIFIEQISANAGLILFLALLGALTMLITKAGGSIAYAKWAVKRIKNPRIASIATALLGVIIFVDDYFNCLTVGSVMRPVTDQLQDLSREAGMDHRFDRGPHLHHRAGFVVGRSGWRLFGRRRLQHLRSLDPLQLLRAAHHRVRVRYVRLRARFRSDEARTTSL